MKVNAKPWLKIPFNLTTINPVSMTTMIRLRVRTRLRTMLLGFEPGSNNFAVHQRWSMMVCFSLTQYTSCSHHQLSRNHTTFILEVAIRDCRNTVKLSLTQTRCDKNKQCGWIKITAPFQPFNILNVLAPLHILIQKYFTDQAWNILYMTFIHSISSLSYDRSKASSKVSSPHRAI